jgi:soluble lytic murein transglycosylase-like protein
VNRWLEVAAGQPRTFYGLIAGRVLGIDKPFTWDVPEITRDRIDSIMRRRQGKRALALLQVGQTRRAERELRALTAIDDRELGRALLAVAEAAKLPSLSLRTSGMLVEADGSPHHGALYPVPQWRPEGGFIVDRALVYAFMRQESQFNTRAKSSAGARGLMQLMPATASFMAKRRFRGWRRNRLYDPELNIALGQKYLRYLIGHEQVQGDMLMLAAAYNGGPGNLAKWRRRAARKRYLDPLLFIESIPSRETRIFIERVLSNLWIYRDRLGQESPSLDALAAGRTPVYKSLDNQAASVAENARN